MKNGSKINKSEQPKIITKNYLETFFKIPPQEAKEIHRKMERLVYDNDAPIVRLGDEADGLYFLEEGQATVVNENGEPVNEMNPGQMFGEYAVLTGELRMSTVKAHGSVVVYRLLPKDFLRIVGKHPKIVGSLMKQTYGQVSVMHKKLASLTRRYRGVLWSPTQNADAKLSGILLTYGVVLGVFAAAFLLAALAIPNMDMIPLWWQLLPVVFLMAFTLRTKRVVEGMILTVLLLGGMLYRGNFILGFGDMMIEGIGNPDTSETIVIMSMVEAVAALLASAGVVSAFKKLAERRVKTKRDSMLGMLLIMLLVNMDECLNVKTAGYCLNEISDKNRIPREFRSLLGSFSMALCSLIPFSLWSAYICGWASVYVENGGNVFLKSIPFNLVGIFAMLFSVLLVFGILPKTKQLKHARQRVENGGSLWPEGSERYFETDAEDSVVGKPVNLLLPMLIWAVSAVVCGMIRNPGAFAMDSVSGLIITLIFMFFLYVGQRLMSPKDYFDTIANGIGNALMPILLLVMAERIAAGLEMLGFEAFLETSIPKLVGGQMILIPAVLFVMFTLIGLGLGSCWGMYGIGIPITMYLATHLNLNLPLCLGAVLAAGIMGVGLCPYLDETAPEVANIGCTPRAFRKLRIQYWIPMAIFCMIGYVILGALFI